MLFPDLAQYTSDFRSHFKQIPPKRTHDLEKVADFIIARIREGEEALLIFICTHNSRRSHMAQIWAQTAAYHFGVAHVRTFSGGTEATAFNPNAVAAMRQAGFRITSDGKLTNPVYTVSFAEDQPPMTIFSKKYDDARNPSDDLCAVMTCSDADEKCPYIPGAAFRIPITYEDPKAFDDTEWKEKAYRERCFQIGVEMFYLLHRAGNS